MTLCCMLLTCCPGAPGDLYSRDLHPTLPLPYTLPRCLSAAASARSSRKGTADTAQHLLADSMRGGPPGRFVRDRAQQERLQAAAERTASRPLQDALRGGVGFHHAAMDAQDRALGGLLPRPLHPGARPAFCRTALAMRGKMRMHDRHRPGLEASPHPVVSCPCLLVTSHVPSLHVRR